MPMASGCAPNYHNNECQGCKMRLEHSTGLVECLMEVIRCQWVQQFGDTRCCEHPAARQFVDFVNSCSEPPMAGSCDELMVA